MVSAPEQVFLLPWFSRGEYSLMRHILAFGTGMPATFDEWFARAEAICGQIEAQHGSIERVDVHAGTFGRWCRKNARPTNERSLGDFIHQSAKAEKQVLFDHLSVRSRKGGQTLN